MNPAFPRGVERGVANPISKRACGRSAFHDVWATSDVVLPGNGFPFADCSSGPPLPEFSVAGVFFLGEVVAQLQLPLLVRRGACVVAIHLTGSIGFRKDVVFYANSLSGDRVTTWLFETMPSPKWPRHRVNPSHGRCIRGTLGTSGSSLFDSS
jgi:hypothetical protein